jgi:hypothetical protein
MKKGTIYFPRVTKTVVCGFNEPVKIGKTNDLEKRRKSYAGYPSKVRFIHQIVTNHATWLERHLHHRFSNKRLQGEWFKLADIDLKPLLRVKIVDRVPDGFLSLSDQFLESPLLQVNLSTSSLLRPRDGEEAETFLQAGGWSVEHLPAIHGSRSVTLVVAKARKNVICTAAHTKGGALMKAWKRAASVGLLPCQDVVS